MRLLTKRQKKILDNYRDVRRLEDLPDGVFELLEKINDTEILWSETNRYLNDNYLKDLYGNNNDGVIRVWFTMYVLQPFL